MTDEEAKLLKKGELVMILSAGLGQKSLGIFVKHTAFPDYTYGTTNFFTVYNCQTKKIYEEYFSDEINKITRLS